MTPCGLMNSPTAEPFEEGMLPAFRKITVETEKIRMPAKCTTCKTDSYVMYVVLLSRLRQGIFKRTRICL